MDGIRRAVLLGGLAVGGACGAAAQQAVPPPPRPVESGPSLAVTMQFLQEKLNDIGKVTLIAFSQNTSDGSAVNNTYTDEVSYVIANPGECRIDFHWKATNNGATTSDGGFWFSLRDVQDIVIKPYVQYQNEINASGGVPNIVTSSTNPNVTALLVRRPHGIYNFFPFTDADLADRVAKAFTHAVELCGGGNKEPF